MIPRALTWISRAWAQDVEDDVPMEDVPVEVPAEDVLAPYRTRFDVLAERTIGTTSVPVKFDWRRSSVHLAATGAFLVELNNFDSVRGGLLARFPTGGTLFEVGVSYVGVWDTPSSRQLGLTPFRQPGRPERVELQGVLALPLAEGVVTAVPKFFPAAQLVLCAYGGLRYSLYPTGWGGMRPGEVGAAIFAPALSDIELANLEELRRAAMQIEPTRYGLELGLGNDVYFEPGLYISPRVMFHVPVFTAAAGGDLWFWADLSLAVGVAL